MNLPKTNLRNKKIAEQGVKRMVKDAPNSATRGVYSIYGDFPRDFILNNGYFQRIYLK